VRAWHAWRGAAAACLGLASHTRRLLAPRHAFKSPPQGPRRPVGAHCAPGGGGRRRGATAAGQRGRRRREQWGHADGGRDAAATAGGGRRRGRRGRRGRRRGAAREAGGPGAAAAAGQRTGMRRQPGAPPPLHPCRAAGTSPLQTPLCSPSTPPHRAAAPRPPRAAQVPAARRRAHVLRARQQRRRDAARRRRRPAAVRLPAGHVRARRGVWRRTVLARGRGHDGPHPPRAAVLPPAAGGGPDRGLPGSGQGAGWVGGAGRGG
jgi:hypothetical protein